MASFIAHGTSPRLTVSLAGLRFGSVLLIALVLTGCSGTDRNEVREPIGARYSVSDPQFRRSFEALLGPSLLAGNRTTTLLNGDQIFPAMLSGVRAARRSINFETYVYWSGEIGHQFADALAERARAGVEVRAILDWQGTATMSGADRSLMTDAGVQLVSYNPIKWYDPRRLNNRTHRKLLIIDGKIGFTGGVGIADLWLGNATDPDHWRDSHYRLEGPAVAQLQGVFLDNWIKSRGEVLHGDAFFPRLQRAGNVLAAATKSSPGRGNPNMRLLFLLSIASARKSIKIESPYFVPDPLLTKELVAATQRGVRVQVIAPGKYIDSKITRATSRSVWGPLLTAGIEIREYQPTMIHAKLLIIDDLWVSVGSSNFDDRSMRLNDEANLSVLDRNFARQQDINFQRDLSQSRRITLEEWERRPVFEKIMAPVWQLARPEL